MDAAHDFIIVGAGSAGCVLADRLSASGKFSVLLLEAGGSAGHPFIDMPKGLGRLLGNRRHVAVYAASTGLNTPEYWLRGRGLGGSSAVNGMIYTPGQPEDYDRLEQAGCTGWNWHSMAPYLRAQEDHVLGAAANRGSGGPLRVTMPPRDRLCDAVIQAAAEGGVERAPDINAAHGTGVIGYFPRTIRGGRRWSAARAFLAPARRRANFSVETGVSVQKIVVEGGTAVGVRCSQGRTYRARREIIVSAGAIETPKLLLLSGIGPAAQLRRLGIDILVDRPSVGANLIEHRCLTMKFRVGKGWSRNHDYRGWRLLANVARYYLGGRGLMATAAFEVGAFLPTTPSGHPDGELLIAPHSIDRSSAPLQTDSFPGMTCTTFVLRPQSEGQIRLSSPNPADAPEIRIDFFASPVDRAAMIALTRKVRALLRQPSLDGIVLDEVYPGQAAQSDEQILDAWRSGGNCGFHLVGSCRMGSDDDAVVDSDLSVRGVAGLRVMDCSVIPFMIAGNTNGPVMAMAARAGDLILRAAEGDA